MDIRVEAELMSLSTYRIERNGSASGAELISLLGGEDPETGTAAFDFVGESGIYDLVVGYYDENDGVSAVTVSQNDAVLDSWNFDSDLSSDLANATTATTREIATGITVNQGDSFTITGTENTFERARIDYLDFIAVNADPSTLALSDSQFEVNEGDSSVTVSVVRTGNLEQTVSVDFETFGETATAGVDYTETSGTLEFEPGVTSREIVIPILEDEATEAAETISLTIDNVAGNGTLGAPRTAEITIIDNETPVAAVVLAESDDNTEVTEAGASDSYEIVLSSQPNAEVNIALTTDEQINTDVGSLTFTPDNWDLPQVVTVTAVDDSVTEGNHTGTISHAVSSEDSLFDGFDLRNINVGISDNDAEGAFILETVASNLNNPTAFDWTPDGETLFIAQKNGVVRLFENDSLTETPFIDISEQVNNTRDRGLLGLAVHPDFPNQPFVYLAFTYDPPEVFENSGLAGEDGSGNRPSRLIRVEADPSTDFTTAIPGSEVVLLGTNSVWENISRPDGNSTNDLSIPPSGITPEGENIRDYLATDSESHSIGAVRFGTDGSLFVSNGDGTSYNAVDPRSVRVQDLDNLSGKMLRIDPLTGEGLPSNPFYDGDPDSNQSKVYSYGLRNPFRFTIDPDTNEPFIGDVGWTEWEEINTGRGANFGWPYFEGGDGTNIRRDGYADLPEAQAFYDSGETATSALYARSHDAGAVAIVMGDFYTGNSFPEIYNDVLFFSDFGDSTVRYLDFSDAGGVEVNTFQEDITGLVQISTAPDSNLYAADLVSGQIIRWRFDETQTASDLII
ncbi:MAG TPA: PQQ-dependent sugar dehydrogenase, partial [Xenococcaceae cyanobacterium]